jgi:anti-anti-sigma regulatory factor
VADGTLLGESSRHLEETIETLMTPEALIIIDLSKVLALDTEGLETIMRITHSARRVGAEVRVTGRGGHPLRGARQARTAS